jgi:TetR/AcrR family transcriptional regulator, cholesterol catabolism regulator
VEQPENKKKSQKRNRRDEILQVAAALFVKKGFESSTIREIGDAAGILSGSLYHHFRSKDEMLHELLKRFLNKLVPMYEAVVAQGSDAKETLRGLISEGLKVSLDNSPELAIVMHERKFLMRHPDFAYVEETMREIERIWFGVLQEGVRAGQFKKSLELNLVLRMMMDLISSTVVWYGPSSRYTLEQVVDTQLELIMSGLLQAPE